MRQYLLRRVLQIVPVLLIVTFLVFALMWAIPGDPVRAFVGPGEALDARQLEVLRREHHLDQPMLVRYVIWLGDALAGDLGRSTINNRLVAQEVGERAVITFQLGLVAWIVAVLLEVQSKETCGGFGLSNALEMAWMVSSSRLLIGDFVTI